MILLRYEMQAYWENRQSVEISLNLTGNDFHRELKDFLYQSIFGKMILKFCNGEHLCLICRFTEQTSDQDMGIFGGRGRDRLYKSIIDRIESELMQYEREEFTYREIEL